MPAEVGEAGGEAVEAGGGAERKGGAAEEVGARTAVKRQPATQEELAQMLAHPTS